MRRCIGARTQSPSYGVACTNGPYADVVSPHTFGAVNAPTHISGAAPATTDAAISTIDDRYDRTTRRRKSRGQSITEFALVLPVMLAFLGLTLDFARVFQAWITLESATRDGAEAAATNAKTAAEALDWAQRTVCLQAQNIPGYRKSTLTSPDDVELCAAPTVTVVSYTLSTSAPGASNKNPLGTATIQTRIPFSPLFAYPIITQNGTWTVTSQASFSIIQGRQ
jgi:Flp pilus assembly protein TadG